MCICAYVHMCICTYVHMCICAYVCVYICVYVYTCICVCVPVCVCIYACMRLCVYACTRVFDHILMHAHSISTLHLVLVFTPPTSTIFLLKHRTSTHSQPPPRSVRNCRLPAKNRKHQQQQSHTVHSSHKTTVAVMPRMKTIRSHTWWNSWNKPGITITRHRMGTWRP